MSGEKNLFSFKSVTSDKTLKTITSLKNNKGSLRYFILVKIIKVFSKSLLPCLAGVINHSIATSSFAEELKLAEVMSAFKKNYLLDKVNYLPISLLSPTCQKYFRKYFSNKSITTYKLIFQTSSQVFGETTVHNTD